MFYQCTALENIYFSTSLQSIGKYAFSGCTAIKSKNVYQIPADAEAWDSPVPGSVLGALWLANVLHPDLLTDTDCTAITEDFYETFYDFTYSKIEK